MGILPRCWLGNFQVDQHNRLAVHYRRSYAAFINAPWPCWLGTRALPMQQVAVLLG